jgi:hypothetical protein
MTAGLTASTGYDDRRIGMVQEGRAKCRRGVAVITFYGYAWMARRAGIRVGANRDNSVVTR